MDEILNKSGLLEIRPVAGECERRRRAGIKRIERIAGAGGNDVAEVLVQKKIVGFQARLPFLTAVVDRDCAVEISLLEVIVQKRGDRPGAVVRVQVAGVVAHHATNIGQNVG